LHRRSWMIFVDKEIGNWNMQAETSLVRRNSDDGESREQFHLIPGELPLFSRVVRFCLHWRLIEASVSFESLRGSKLLANRLQCTQVNNAPSISKGKFHFHLLSLWSGHVSGTYTLTNVDPSQAINLCIMPCLTEEPCESPDIISYLKF